MEIKEVLFYEGNMVTWKFLDICTPVIIIEF